MTARLLFIIILLLVFDYSYGAAIEDPEPRLNYVSVLLPYHKGVSAELEASPGCFQWTSSNPTLVAITLIEPTSLQCSKKVKIQSVKDTPTADPALPNTWDRDISLITATDIRTGRTLRCEVFLDILDTIEIFTTNRKIFKGELEQFDLIAKDTKGNTFTSIEGIEVNWDIKSPQLSRESFRENNIETSQKILDMESRSKTTSTVLVRGAEFGDVKVYATILGMRATELKSDYISISVYKQFMLDPQGPIVLPPKTKYQCKLVTLVQNKKENIPLDGSYEWEIKHADLAKVDKISGLIETKEKQGNTTLFIKSTLNRDIVLPYDIIVVSPSSLSLEISPADSKLPFLIGSETRDLVVGSLYKLKVAVKDGHNNRLTSTESFKFKTELSDDDWTIEHMDKNEGYILARPKRTTISPVNVQLLDHEIAAMKQNLNIVSPITLNYKEVHLPYDPYVRQSLRIIPSGGSGKYQWSSTDDSIVSVTDGEIYAIKEGNTTINCSDTQNPYNVASVNIMVSKPQFIALRSGYYEIPFNGSGKFTAYLSPSKDGSVCYTACDNLTLHWTLSETKSFIFQKVPPPLKPGACSVAFIQAKDIPMGVSTQLWITYQKELKYQTKLVSFKPLTLSQDEIHLTKGGTEILIVSGGPIPWPDDPSKHFENIIYDKNAIEINEKKHSQPGAEHWIKYTIKCLKYFEQNITIEVGNGNSKLHPIPVTIKKVLKYSCSEPSALFIYPVGPSGVVEPTCAQSMYTLMEERKKKNQTVNELPTYYYIRNSRSLEFALNLFDKNDRRFNNFNGTSTIWKSDRNDLLEIRDIDHSARQFVFSDKEGVVQVTIKVPDPGFERTFNFHLYSKIQLSPSSAALYLHPDSRVQFKHENGSRLYNISVDNSYAEVVPYTGDILSSEIYLRPKAPGEIDVKIIDLCSPSDEAISKLTIGDIAKVKIVSDDLVEIGQSVKLKVIAIDPKGNEFGVDQMKPMQIAVITDREGVIEVLKEINGINTFKIFGKTLGTASLSCSIKKLKGDELMLKGEDFKESIASEPILIHVFPPFQIEPSKLTLIPGASYQLQWQGGPVRGYVNFTFSKTDTIASITKTGLITANSPGTALINAIAYGSHQDDIRLSPSSCTLQVKYISSISIFSATNFLALGNEILLRVEGPDRENPFVYGSLPLVFHWESANPKVVEILPCYRGADVSVEDEASFTVRALAIGEGRTTISVTIKDAPTESRLKGLTAQIFLDVKEPLRLLTPRNLLLPPGTNFQILTNYDKNPEKRLIYDILPGSPKELVTLSRSGLIQSNYSSGTVLIRVTEIDLTISNVKPIVIPVVVKPVSGIALNPIPPVNYDLMVGQTQTFEIYLHDENGNVFNSYTSFTFKYFLNRQNIANIKIIHLANSTDKENTENKLATVEVSAVSPGLAILNVVGVSQTSNEQTFETYIPIHVQNAIFPPNPYIHLGGKITFSIGINETSLHKKPWKSTNTAVLQIDPDTGEASALAIGESTISYSSGVSTQTVARVARAGYLNISSPILRFNSNPQQSNLITLHFPIHVHTEFRGPEIIDIKNHIHNNFIINCDILQVNYLTGTPQTDTPEKFCVISYNRDVTSLIWDTKKLGLLRVSVTDTKKSYTIEESKVISFTPLFHITPKQYTLSLGKPTQMIFVNWYLDKETKNALPDLEIEYNSLLLKIKRVEQDEIWRKPLEYGRVDENTVVYTVTFANIDSTAFNNEKISFRYSGTGQQMDILVSYSYIEPPKTSGNFSSALMIIIFTIIICWSLSKFITGAGGNPALAVIILVSILYGLYLFRG